MRFWDTSALVALLWEEASSARVRATMDEDPTVLAWWGTSTECMSAIARRERDGQMDEPTVGEAVRRLVFAAAAWEVVTPGDRVRRTAARLLRTHDLGAPDALQLAAAAVSSEDNPGSLAFVTLDRRLALAASKEGFLVIEPVSG